MEFFEEELYGEAFLERYFNPRNKKPLENPSVKVRDSNPLCGDVVELYLRVDEEGRITDASFEGHGCVISQVSTDILVDMIRGRSLEEVLRMEKQELLGALGISVSPMRLKCALLPLKAAKLGAAKALEALMDRGTGTSRKEP